MAARNREAIRPRPWLLPLVAVAAALVFALLPYLFVSGGPSAGREDTRIKGPSSSLQIFRNTERGPALLVAGDTVRQGDVLQVRYGGVMKKYGAIFSVDGRGAVTLHFPENRQQQPVLEPGGKAALEYAYELDDAPGFECFYFVTSDSLFEVDTVLGLARRAAGTLPASSRLELPAGMAQEALCLKKETL